MNVVARREWHSLVTNIECCMHRLDTDRLENAVFGRGFVSLSIPFPFDIIDERTGKKSIDAIVNVT